MVVETAFQVKAGLVWSSSYIVPRTKMFFQRYGAHSYLLERSVSLTPRLSSHVHVVQFSINPTHHLEPPILHIRPMVHTRDREFVFN